MLDAKTAVADLLPLLNDAEREFCIVAAERSLVHLKMRLTDWAANHEEENVRTEAQRVLDSI